eukprot:GHVT01097563.1.p1 GENE.GHVT01097563.1~~GHVT01097563.1.p1  ORF type:complete len:396 (-),score=86.02 GHVT01097563.1:21-1208(-)
MGSSGNVLGCCCLFAARAFEVRLDGQPMRSPGGARVLLPNFDLAMAVAFEWQRMNQDVDLRRQNPERIPLTSIVVTATDALQTRLDVDSTVACLIKFLHTDLTCLRHPPVESSHVQVELPVEPVPTKSSEDPQAVSPRAPPAFEFDRPRVRSIGEEKPGQTPGAPPSSATPSPAETLAPSGSASNAARLCALERRCLDPIVATFSQRYGVQLATSYTLSPPRHPQDSIARLERRLCRLHRAGEAQSEHHAACASGGAETGAWADGPSIPGPSSTSSSLGPGKKSTEADGRSALPATTPLASDIDAHAASLAAPVRLRLSLAAVLCCARTLRSLVLALECTDGSLHPAAALRAASLEEEVQQGKWGKVRGIHDLKATVDELWLRAAHTVFQLAKQT